MTMFNFIHFQNKGVDRRKTCLSDKKENKRGDLGNVRGERVEKDLLEVVEHDPPLFHRDHHRRKVVVQKDNVGGILGDVGARYAHGPSLVIAADEICEHPLC